MPVILVIEDLDTILSDEDQENQWSFIVQTITNFLEWVWETPVTLVVSTNFLHRFPQRILRPKRFNKIIAYPTTPSEKEFRAIAEQHIKKRKIDVEWLDILMNMRERMEYYSAAYIAKVVESIQEYTDFIQIFGWEEMSKEKLLEQILAEMVVPLEDIKAADRQFQETVNWITGKLKRTQIWYK